jgi:hypothetical protein
MRPVGPTGDNFHRKIFLLQSGMAPVALATATAWNLPIASQSTDGGMRAAIQRCALPPNGLIDTLISRIIFVAEKVVRRGEATSDTH